MNAKFLLMASRAAARSLARNRLRSALTVLGIVFGAAAVVAMVAISEGARALIQQRIDSLGTNLLMVFPGSAISQGAHSGQGAVATLTVADGEAIKKECPSVVAAAPVRRQPMQIIAGNRNWRTTVQGVGIDFLQVRNWALDSGRAFNVRDEKATAKVCLIGRTVTANLFAPGQDPLGASVRIRDVPFRVIGTLAPKGQSGWGHDQDDTILIPFATAERRLMG